MNLYVQGSLHNDSLHDAGMPRPLRGHLKHGGRSAFVCEGQLPLLGSFDMTVGRLVREDYFIWIKDNSGIVRATMLWNQHRNSYRNIDVIEYVPEHAWSIIGYDLQKLGPSSLRGWDQLGADDDEDDDDEDNLRIRKSFEDQKVLVALCGCKDGLSTLRFIQKSRNRNSERVLPII